MESRKESLRKIEQAKAYVSKNSDLLRTAYGDNYIAVRDGVVLGYNKNRFELARNMEIKFRDFTVLIGSVEDILNPRGCELPSPEVER